MKEKPNDHDEDDKGSKESQVKVPEEFQKKAHALLASCSSKQCLQYLRDCCNEKEDEYRKKENESKDGEHEFSKAGMPSTSY